MESFDSGPCFTCDGRSRWEAKEKPKENVYIVPSPTDDDVQAIVDLMKERNWSPVRLSVYVSVVNATLAVAEMYGVLDGDEE